MKINSADRKWLRGLDDLVNGPYNPVQTRGFNTNEITAKHFMFHMWDPVITIPERKLNYRFLAAEAYWILTGDNLVKNIEPYNKNIAQFSDDGEVFFGAYGTKIMPQIEYVVEAFRRDLHTRQAVINIWRESPPPTKDVPCTISMVFNIRQGLLHAYVTMRSSDIWLGIPYDIFNFSMVSHYILARLYEEGIVGTVGIGDLYLTAVSAHIYDYDIPKAKELLKSYNGAPAGYNKIDYVPAHLGRSTKDLLETLMNMREKDYEHMRWWKTV